MYTPYKCKQFCAFKHFANLDTQCALIQFAQYAVTVLIHSRVCAVKSNSKVRLRQITALSRSLLSVPLHVPQSLLVNIPLMPFLECSVTENE